jgi:acetylornithine deacetylase/succinyl-diaminopimelate desuccinylase-like protein
MFGAAGGNFHAPDEWTSIPELAAVASIVADAAVRYCGTDV